MSGRGAGSNRIVVGDFELRAPATIVTSRGIGGNHDLVRADSSNYREKFALSGIEQNPDLTDKSVRELLSQRLGNGASAPVEAFNEHGGDFIVADTLEGTFLGGCLVSGRAAGRSIAAP
uniref:hypothetical protein n=1 Tax=Salinibacterium sp. TMP30 TaxID=3138237 RepID=UPI004053AFDB